MILVLIPRVQKLIYSIVLDEQDLHYDTNVPMWMGELYKIPHLNEELQAITGY